LPPPSAPSPAVPDEPLLPRTSSENDLRLAVGASPLVDPTTRHGQRGSAEDRSGLHDSDDDDVPRRPRNRRLIAAAALAGAAGLAVASLAFLGSVNSDRYVLVCEAERAVPHRGRGFPPWGTRPLEGEAWKPLKIAPETRCQSHETEDVQDLERGYLAMILQQATALLTAREVTHIDDAESLLKQALLLTRPVEREPEKLAFERNEHHQAIKRLLGDVTYWRASSRLRDAKAALSDAAKQFERAAEQQPRHVSDAPARAAHARKLAQDLEAGPGAPSATTAGSAAPAATATGSAAPATAPPERGIAPAGVELPVEPAPGSDPPPDPAAPPDAGVPGGGVLL
jgi:hypothetical protein